MAAMLLDWKRLQASSVDRNLRDLERQARAGDRSAIVQLHTAWKHSSRRAKIVKTIDSRAFGVKVLCRSQDHWVSYYGEPRSFCTHKHKEKKPAISCAKRRAFRIFIEPDPMLWAEYVGLLDAFKPIALDTETSGIVFDKDGLLIAGQHRLLSVGIVVE